MKIRRYILAVLSGVLLVLSFPEINLSYLSWLALVPLLVAIHDARWKNSLILGLITGVVYFGGTLNWLMALTPYSTLFLVALGFIVLTLYISTYVFIFTVLVNYIKRTGLAYSFLVAVIWTSMEILRAHVATGFPWVNLAHAQWQNLPLLQICSITGMYGITFVIVMVNGMIANFLFDISKWKSSLKSAIIPLAILILCFIFGFISLTSSLDGEKIKIAMVPGNIKQDEKISSWGNKADWIFDRYVRITQSAADKEPDMIVWPETAVPQLLFPRSRELDRLEFLIRRWDAYFLMGVPSYEGEYPDWRFYNSAYLLSSKGEVIDKYDKIHLVPLGEYFPLKRYLPKAIQDFVTGVSDYDSGNRYTIFHAPPAKIGVVICFESIFSSISRKFVNEGTNVMCIITNDAWFVGTFAPQQHFAMAPFRAVENRVSVFRCANYGVSCIIDPWGRVTEKLLPESEQKYLIGEVGLREGGTFYTRHGDYLPWACLAMTLFLVFQTWWHKRNIIRKIQGGSNVIGDSHYDGKGKGKASGSRRASLTSPAKKKK